MSNQELRKCGNELLERFKEEINACVILGDIDRLNRLTVIFKRFLAAELVSSLRKKGFGKELRELCDKAGRVSTK